MSAARDPHAPVRSAFLRSNVDSRRTRHTAPHTPTRLVVRVVCRNENFACELNVHVKFFLADMVPFALLLVMVPFALLPVGSTALLFSPAPLRASKSVAALNGHRHTAPRMAEEPQTASAADKAAATAAPAPTAKFDLKSIAKEEAKKGAGL